MAKRFGVFLAIVAILVGAQLVLHSIRHDVTPEFSGNEDEPSHFVTGLMIRDFFAQHAEHNPVHFARAFYLHYPKVAFGSWPPLLHFGLGAWMLFFHPSRESASLYIDLMTALLALASAVVARRVLPLPAAIAVGIAVWLSPITQMMDQVIGADIQYSLFSMLCVYLFATYVDAPTRTRAFWFGLALLGGVMTKNNGLFLAISVPLVVLLTRSFRILRRWDAWLAVLPSVAIVALWQYLTLPFNVNNMTGRNAETALGTLFVSNFVELSKLPWVGLMPLVLWGVYRKVVVPLIHGDRVGSTDAASIALMLGAPLFHAMLPHGAHQRYLMACLAPMLIFCIEGAMDLLSLARLAQIPNRVKVIAAAAVVVIPAVARPIGPLPHSGYGPVAAEVIEHYPASNQPSVLISAAFSGESALVAELTVRDDRPSRWILRATKILRRKVGVLNRDTDVVTTPRDEMLRYFQELPVSMVILVDDGDLETKSSHDYLAGMIEARPDMFRLVSTTPVGSTCQDAPCVIRLFEFTGAGANPHFAPEKLPQNMPLWQGM